MADKKKELSKSSLSINYETKKKLILLKMEGNFKSFNDLINELIKKNKEKY